MYPGHRQQVWPGGQPGRVLAVASDDNLSPARGNVFESLGFPGLVGVESSSLKNLSMPRIWRGLKVAGVPRVATQDEDWTIRFENFFCRVQRFFINNLYI